MYVDLHRARPTFSGDRCPPRNTLQAKQIDELVDLGLLGREHRSSSKTPGKKTAVHWGPKIAQDGVRESQGSQKPYLERQTVLANHERQRPSAGDQRSAAGSRLQSSSIAHPTKHRNSMFANRGRETRRERTFIGSACATCEEPLEHMLRGERILQLSCGHVSHEACFYEYIKEFEAQSCPTCDAPLGLDTSRGGAIDFENFNKLVRSAQTPDINDRFPETQTTPTPWENDTTRQNVEARKQQQRNERDHLLPERTRSTPRLSSPSYAPTHGRNESADTRAASAMDYAETRQSHGRRHDYDVQSMETTLSAPKHAVKNPVPAPLVTVRSEFPTLTKSRQQQSLTCLITVEVVDGKWTPNLEDLRSPPSASGVDSNLGRKSSKAPSRGLSEPVRRGVDSVHEDLHALEVVKDELYRRVDNWHGLDFARFGRLLLHGIIRVGKDRQAWQELECYLFKEMLICVKEKKSSPNDSQQWDGPDGFRQKSRCTLKGSILIKKHLKHVETVPDHETLTLSLSVAELPAFHLQFPERGQLELWRRQLINIHRTEPPEAQQPEYEQDTSGTDDDEYNTRSSRATKRVSSVVSSSQGGARSHVTAPTEYTNSRAGTSGVYPGAGSLHVPLDIVVVVPVSSSMQGLKINLLRDALRFLVSSLGDRDRMGLVTFGSGGGGVPLVGMTTKAWNGWPAILESIRPLGQKSMRADVVEGANVAMDLLMQRKASNPLSSILLISDSSTSDPESVDFVVSRAEAAKISIHSFGLGLTHKPDTMVELSTRTKASYTYVKDWMMLRECLAGCIGALQCTSHQNVKLKLRLPEGSPAKFVKISGALHITKRATGRDAEAMLGDLRFGDKRDVLVQLVIAPDTSTPDSVPSDPWENVIAGLEALGGPFDADEAARLSVEELPLIQADLSWGDILREGNLAQLPRPSLLAITMLPPVSKKGLQGRPPSPPIPPHPSIVQRRMELLTSDMLSRALTLVARGQNERADHLLGETRSILRGLGKGGLPPLPPPPTSALPATPRTGESRGSPVDPTAGPPDFRRTPSPRRHDNHSPFNPAAGIDATTMVALDSELQSSLEWILHPAIFGRDSRKSVLQAIGVISSQRGYTYRTPAESLWASRIPGIKLLSEQSRDWRESSVDSLAEEM